MKDDASGSVPRRRRRSNEVGGRATGHHVRVTPEEAARLSGMAAERHMSVPRLLVEATLSGGTDAVDVRREEVTLLFGSYRMLAAMGNNLNQLTRAANATGEISEEVTHTLRRVRMAAERLDEVLARYESGRR